MVLALVQVFLVFLACGGALLVVARRTLEPHLEQVVELKLPPLCCSAPTGNTTKQTMHISYDFTFPSLHIYSSCFYLLSAFGLLSLPLLSGLSPCSLFFYFLLVLFV